MKNIFLSIPEGWYRIVHERAQKKGQRDNEYIFNLIKSNLDTDQSYSQKNSVGKSIKGEDIINNGNLVRLGGIYYNYRLAGKQTSGRVSEISKDTVYDVTGLDGNIAILSPQNQE